ncbi:MAG: PAS domain S-box protein, partial [Desulfobacteraceae bacterium]|nr:PAS domain S-box protein [Desulfobacteraceae bacterium]
HEENQAIFQNVVDTGEPFFVEAKPFEFPDQPERGVTYWNWSLIPIKDDKKAVTGLVFTLAEVTERVQAEKELEDIFNLSPDMVGVLTTEGILLKVNPAWEQILGYTQKELLDLGWAELVHPDDVEETNKVVEKQLKGGSVVNFVNRYKCKGGSYKTLEWQATYAKGGIVHATARDITERKKAEEALRESESRWRSLAESSPDHILTLAPDLTIQYANFASPGLTIDDIVGKPIYAFVEEEKQEEIKTILMGVLNSKQSALYETEYPAPDGGIIYYETHAIARKTGGDVIGLTLSSRDITERKQAEMELRESEEKYQKLFDGLPYGGEVIDTQGYIIDCSESNAIVYGYERDELIGKHVTELLAPEAKEIYRELFPKILNGEPGQAEIQMIHKDGSLVNIIRSARPLFNQQGSVVSVLAINTDITERKKAEAELHSVAQQWQNTFDAVTDAICILDTEQRIIRTNQAMNEMFPEQKGKMVGKHCFEVVHGSQELIENCPVLRMRHTLQRESLELELGERILEVTADPILDDSGALTGIVHSLCNITNRVQMEQELTTATNIINRSPAVVFLWKNKEGWPVEFVSTNVNNLIGYSAQALMEGKVSYNEIIHSDDLNRVTKEVVTASTKKDQTSFAHEPYRIITKHGDMKWVGDRTLIRRDSRGAITHYEGVVYDITEHKLADEALSLRSEELAALLRVSQALNASLELATVLQETTNSATDLMGIDSAAIYLFEGEELYLGATTPPLDSQMPEDFRRAAIADHPHIHKTVTTGHPVILDDTGTGELTDAERAISDERGLRTIIYIPILSGQKKWGILILGTIGKTRTFSEEEINLCMTLTNQVALSIQNAKLHEEVIRHSRELEGQITERKQAEKEKDILLDQVQMANERLKTLNRERINLQEEERKRISQELHDELGQALTAITLDLGIIERELDPETDRDIRKRLSETRTIANELDQKIDELAFDLRPSILDDLGLIPTLKWYADRYSQRAEVEVEIEVIGRKKRLPPEIETALYRITQEALTNVAKHAQAKKIKLQLDRQLKTVTVSIEDDGQGFDVEELQTTLAPPQGMGLAGMKDRISLLGGRLEIHSKPGEGTRIEIEIPL